MEKNTQRDAVDIRERLIDITTKVKKDVADRDDAIDKIARTILFNKLKRITKRLYFPTNLLISGKSGTGKTFTGQKIAEHLNTDTMVVDCTQLTKSGYEGNNVSEIISNLATYCEYNISRISNSIIFLDEFDKIIRPNEGRTTEAANELLALMEGQDIIVQRKDDKGVLSIDTSELIFICCGAFNNEDMKEANSNSIDHQKLLNKGFSHELIGRFHATIHLDNLNLEPVKNALKNSKDSILNLYKTFYNAVGIKIVWSEAVIDYIAERIVDPQNQVGFRWCNVFINNLLSQEEYSILNPDNMGKNINITLKDIRDKKPIKNDINL